MKSYRRPYKEKTVLQYILKFITDLAVVICLAYLIVSLLGNRFVVVGNSMNESLKNDDVLLIDKVTYEFVDPERFDLILFEASGINAGKSYVKRIIGLPGETVSIENGKIYINGMVLENDVTDIQILTPGLAGESVTLGENEYFVLGDNRNNSEDSRFYTVGNINRKDIVGRPWVRVYPFSAFGFVE